MLATAETPRKAFTTKDTKDTKDFGNYILPSSDFVRWMADSNGHHPDPDRTIRARTSLSPRNSSCAGQLHLCAQTKRIRDFCDAIGVLDEFLDLGFGSIGFDRHRELDVLGPDRITAPIRADPELNRVDVNSFAGGFAEDVVAVAAADREEEQFAAAESQAFAAGILRAIDGDRARTGGTQGDRGSGKGANLNAALGHVSPQRKSFATKDTEGTKEAKPSWTSCA